MNDGRARDAIKALDDLMLCYFHPDWTLNHGGRDDVLVDFRAVDPDLAAQSADEILALVASERSDAELTTLLLHPQSPDPRRGLSTRIWLEHVREQLKSPI